MRWLRSGVEYRTVGATGDVYARLRDGDDTVAATVIAGL